MSFLEITSLSKSFRVGGERLEVLRDLGLSVEAGEMVVGGGRMTPSSSCLP